MVVTENADAEVAMDWLFMRMENPGPLFCFCSPPLLSAHPFPSSYSYSTCEQTSTRQSTSTPHPVARVQCAGRDVGGHGLHARAR